MSEDDGYEVAKLYRDARELLLKENKRLRAVAELVIAEHGPLEGHYGVGELKKMARTALGLEEV